LQEDTARNPKPLWYYLTTLPWQTLPWTLLPLLVLPVVLRKAWSERTHHQRFLVLWLLVMLIVLSLASGKHHHYLIYALPPISLWAAQGLVRLRQLLQGLENRKLHVAALACALTLSVSGTALAMAWRWPEWTGPIAVLASLVHLALLAPLLGLHVQRLRAGVVIGFLALAASVGVVHGTVMPVLDTYTTETQFLHRLAIRSAKAGPLLVYKVDPARVAVYTRLRTEFFDDLDLLERRSLELPSALVVTSVQREASLARVGEPEELDRVTPPGRRQRDPSLHLAVYRMTWRERPESMARNP
jgi:4-amino-4-deoxy-L-arabinose transferase-like glycosyltransferase